MRIRTITTIAAALNLFNLLQKIVYYVVYVRCIDNI